MKGYMYILECSDGSYYTGSTKNLELRFQQHQKGEGANHTRKRLPVKLVYYEEFSRIDQAFYREKQVQRWRREKKMALINGAHELLSELAMAYRDVGKEPVASGTSATRGATVASGTSATGGATVASGTTATGGATVASGTSATRGGTVAEAPEATEK